MKIRNAHKDMLRRLQHGPKSNRHFTHGDVSSQLGFHHQRYLAELEQNGMVVVIAQHGDEMWHITNAGRKALEGYIPVQKNKAKITAGTMSGTYDGAELRQTCMRPGAYDYLMYPSIYHGERVYPRIND